MADDEHRDQDAAERFKRDRGVDEADAELVAPRRRPQLGQDEPAAIGPGIKRLVDVSPDRLGGYLSPMSFRKLESVHIAKRRELVARLVNGGHSERAIAIQLGLSRSTVWGDKQALVREGRITLRMDAFR